MILRQQLPEKAVVAKPQNFRRIKPFSKPLRGVMARITFVLFAGFQLKVLKIAAKLMVKV